MHSGGSRGALYSIGRHTSVVGRAIPRVVLVRVGSSAPRWIRSRTARFSEGQQLEVAIQETADNPLDGCAHPVGSIDRDIPRCCSDTCCDSDDDSRALYGLRALDRPWHQLEQRC